MTTPAELMDTYLELKDQADTIKTAMDQIKTQLAAALPDGGEIDGHKVTMVRGRINWNRVRTAYPVNDFPQLYRQEIVLDQDKAQAMIAPAQLDEYRAQATVSIR
ncbi:hypothetical protein [Trueperella bernardiae]|uniref:hypothetical protein n=1 Tax=Trueperella bernardiae TaxID=59561 RepID=UPI0008397CCE|nr:hypothetical protein [Trueperella bernardiae]OCW59790.1 hypothetical protein AKG36_08440 [Trueperella bernardiae]